MVLLPRSFYARSPLVVAPALLGKVLVRQLDGQLLSGRIVEVEAYLARGDEAAHGYRGLTKSNSSLFKAAGHAYIHSIHQQQCMDIVTETVDVPSAVLLRALEPLTGVELMKQFRGKERLTDLTSGPGKLTKALQITKSLDGIDVTDQSSPLAVYDDGYTCEEIVSSPRIGISKAQEFEYRFYLKGNQFISKR